MHNIQSYIRTDHIHACIHVCMHTSMRTSIHARMHAYTHIHTYTHTHTCTHAYRGGISWISRGNFKNSMNQHCRGPNLLIDIVREGVRGESATRGAKRTEYMAWCASILKIHTNTNTSKPQHSQCTRTPTPTARPPALALLLPLLVKPSPGPPCPATMYTGPRHQRHPA